MNVARYMRLDPITVLAAAPLSKVREVMEENALGILLIVSDAGELTGFITKGALRQVQDWDLPVEEACFEARFAVSKDDTLEKAALILLENQLALLPVVDGQRLVGIITQRDILFALARGLGIGLKGTRFVARVTHLDDLYAIMRVLQTNNAQLVGFMCGNREGEYQDIILRVREVADKEKLCAELEEALHQAQC